MPETVGLEQALLWYEGLFAAAQELSTLPRIHAIASENSSYNVEVRRRFYYGPTKRRGSIPYRLLFYIIEPQEDEAEGVVRILHLWHGSKRSL